MAKLVLDVDVKGQENIKKVEKSTVKSAERMQKAFNAINSKSGLSRLASNVQLTAKSFKKVNEASKDLAKNLKDVEDKGFVQAARNAKKLLQIEQKINDELDEQAKLQLKLDDKGGSNRTRALSKQLKVLKNQTKELRKQTGEYKKQKTLITKLRGSMSGAGKFILGGAGFAAGALGIVGIISSVQRLIGLWQRLSAEVAESFYTINTEAEQSRILLSTALGSESAGAQMFEEVLEMATRMPFSIRAISDSFVKLQTAGLDGAAEKVTTLANAISAFGGSDEDLRLATIAIQQMAGKGVAAMEELRRQLGERVPTAIRGMARELGLSYLELVDKVSTGTLLFNEEAQGALFRGLDDYMGAAEKRMDSMLGAVRLLKTAWQRLMIDIGDGKGAFSSLGKVVRKVADALNSFRQSDEGKRVIEDLSEAIVTMVTKVTPEAVYGAFQLIIKIAKATVAIIKAAVNLGLQLLEKFSKKADKPELFVNKIFRGASEKMGGPTGGPNFEVQKTLQDALSAFDEIEKEWYSLAETVESKKIKPEIILPRTEQIKKELDSLGDKMEIINNVFKEGGNDQVIDLQVELGIKSASDKIDYLYDKVEFLQKKAASADLFAEDGAKNALGYLEQARKVLQDMEQDARKVTKAEVEAARLRYNSYLEVSRGGKAAGSTAELQKRYAHYKKYLKAYKDGEAIITKGDGRRKQALAEVNRQQLEIYNKLKAEKEVLYEKERALEAEKQAIKENRNIATENNAKIEENARKEGEAAFQAQKNAIDTARLRELGIGVIEKETAALERQKEVLQGMPQYNPSGTSYEPYDGRYAGGPVTGGTPYIVGEKGPELFVPNNSGQIIPNNQLGGSGDTTEIYLNFSNRRVGPLQSTKQIARDVLKEFEIMQGALS